MRRTIAIVLTGLLLFAACGNDDEDSSNGNGEPKNGAQEIEGAPEFTPATILIDRAGDGSTVLLNGEVADTDETRAFGLMKREELPDRYGMAFVYFEERQCCFYMKDTLVPLSIAFFDSDGEIVDIKDMDPCKKEPCPLFASKAPYVGGLEVEQGSFERWNVSIGDRVRIVQ
jgi:uncharacterized protein